jgi:lysine 2,3-aminomutase
MGVPAYVIDAPGGGGKIPVLPDYLQSLGEEVVLKNYRGETYRYLNPPQKVEEDYRSAVNDRT